MRAHVFANPEVAFFEVDQKAVLEFKHSVLAGHGIEQAPSVFGNYLEVDVPAGLAEIGFDPAAPTVMVWEGNTMYLPPESIMPFLNRLAGAMSSFRLAFDYFAVDLQNRDFEADEDRRRGKGNGRVVPDGVPQPDGVRAGGAVQGGRIGVVCGAGRGIRAG